jgi:hypothetical protein
MWQLYGTAYAHKAFGRATPGYSFVIAQREIPLRHFRSAPNLITFDRTDDQFRIMLEQNIDAFR